MDLDFWNERETWKFSWDERVESFFCFGETAWGDQYAYRRRAAHGGFDPEVYFLDGIALQAGVLAPNFAAFLTDEFLRNATRPYDSQTVEAMNRLGPVAPDQHWVHVPSLALGGPESVDNVISLLAITAMIAAGDIDTSLSAAPESASIAGIEPWRDQRGRDRLRVLYLD